MKKHLLTIISTCALIATSSCASYRFTKTGFDDGKFNRRPLDCDITVLTSLPTDREYVEIGLCDGKSPGGGVLVDKSPKAIEQLKKCACENGGNALLLRDNKENGGLTSFGYSQQVVKASGVVYYVYPKKAD